MVYGDARLELYFFPAGITSGAVAKHVRFAP